MPTYEYQCESCKAKIILTQKMSDKPKRKCPTCKAYALKRLITGGTGFIISNPGGPVLNPGTYDINE